MLVILVINKII